MHSSYRFIVRIILSLFVIVVVCFSFLGSRTATTHAARTTHWLSKNAEAPITPSTCGIWNVISSPNPGNTDILNGITAISASNVWAVGGYNTNGVEQTLIENWNGTNWSVVSSPNAGSADNFLNGVTRVPRTNQVWAVGRYYNASIGLNQTLIEYWNGTNWSVVPSPNSASENNLLYGVTATSANNAWAVGYVTTSSSAQTLIEHWDGTNWNIISAPNNGAPYIYFYGVTAVSSKNVWAVGSYIDINNIQQTFIEHWNGKNWSIIPNPNPSGATGSLLLSVVHSPGSNQMWAVGFYSTSNASALTLTEYWNGTSWNITSSPNPGSANNFIFNTLEGVTAVSASNVWAVGTYYIASGYQTLVEHWDGTSWSVVSSPTPGSGQNTLLSAVRIPNSGKVWAVGFYSNISSPPQTLSEYYC